MADITPSTLFPNMTADVTGISIPYTDLSGLTQAEADPATGDGREVLRILVNQAHVTLTALAPENRPTKINFTKPNPQGIGVDQIRQSYTFSFDVNYDASGVAMVSEA